MSADIRWLAEAIPQGSGCALDLGGGEGGLRMVLEQKGWRYVNVDLHPGQKGYAICADAHCLPFRDGVFGLVVAKDSLEHFENPWRAIEEIRWRQFSNLGPVHVALSRGRLLQVYSSGF